MTNNNNFAIKKSHIFWLFTAISAISLLYSVRGTIFPFVISFLFSIILVKFVDFLEKIKIPRAIGSLLCTFCLFFIIIYSFYISIPMLYRKIMAIVDLINIKKLESFDFSNINKMFYDFGINVEAEEFVSASFKSYFVEIISALKNILNGIILSGMNLLTMIGFFLFSPMITFFMLKDSKKISKHFYSLVPCKYLDDIKILVKDIKQSVFGYIEGQLIVTCFLTLFYGILLSIIGIKQAFFIGFMVGIASFIPYVGFYAASGFGLISVYNQFGDIKHILITVGVLFLGQIVEGNFITPRIMGSKVGLHPNWVIFGMLSCIPIFGLLGVVFAVPITAVCAVFVRYFIAKYRDSEYYRL